MTDALRVALNLPRPAAVRTGRGGVPVEVDGQAIEQVRESWLVEDRWWTAQPLRRRCWEVVTTTGRNLVVFHDLTTGARAHDQRNRVPAHSSGMRVRPIHSAGTPTPGGWFLQGP
jgi:hypothetical protein